MRIAGKTFVNERGDWLGVVSTHGGMVSYNSSRCVQSPAGAKACSRPRFIRMLDKGGYKPKEAKK